MAVKRKIDNRSTAGLGSLRRTFHTTMLIAFDPPRGALRIHLSIEFDYGQQTQSRPDIY